MDKKTVYFIQAGDCGSIKIGITGNLQDRLRSIQNGNPLQLSVIYSFECESFKASKIEKRLHEKFEQFRLKGEWFHPHSFILKTIEDIKNVGMVGLTDIEDEEAEQVVEDLMIHYRGILKIGDTLKKKGDAFLYHYVIREVNELLSDLKSGKY